MDIISYIEHVIVSMGWFGVFFGSILEEIIAPIPSAVVQSGAGFLLLGDMPFSFALIGKIILLISIPSAFGVVIGSIPIYSLAYFGGQPALKKWGKYLFIKYDKLIDVRERMLSYKSLPLILLLPRFIPLIPNALITAGCGLLRIPLRTYLWTTFVGTFIRAIYLGLLGWSAKQASLHFSATGGSRLSQIGIFIGFLCIASVFSMVVIEYVRRKEKKAYTKRKSAL